MQKLTDADYDGVIEDSITRAIRRYASRQILVGDGTSGKFKGIFYNPASESDDIIDRNTDITTITAVADDTLDEIIYSYGGDEEVEDVAVLILSKKDLKKFAKLRDKQGRKVYTIVNHGNTGTIDEVPYIINSACAEIGGTKMLIVWLTVRYPITRLPYSLILKRQNLRITSLSPARFATRVAYSWAEMSLQETDLSV